jgi:hypothetical protein
MDISEYRAEYASFNSDLELARYQLHVGITSKSTAGVIYERYSDLSSVDAIAELKSRLAQTSPDFETERSGLQRLLTAACGEHVRAQAEELTTELARCESSAPVRWKGTETAIAEVPALLASESQKTQRDEIAARWIESLSICDELRLARLSSLNESAHLLGFDSYRLLMLATYDSSLDRAAAVRTLWEQTEPAVRTGLSRLLARELPHFHADKLSHADQAYFAAMPWLDRQFPEQRRSPVHSEIMSSLGMRMDPLHHILMDVETGGTRTYEAACFPVAPPSDVRLALPSRSGAGPFLDGLEAFGKALHHVWCSPVLAKRHPEFVYSETSGTNAAFGYLFRYLPIDRKWILEFLRPFNAIQAGELSKDLALELALRIRRLCADALYQERVYEGGHSRDELQSIYKDLQERMTPFRLPPESFLFALQTSEQPAMHLRALAFSFGLLEYLRVRYGYRWWASRKAGDELIDLWSTSSRYSVEELAALIGFGDLNYDLLAEAVNTALTGV